MIELYTGTPGAGKTLSVVAHLIEKVLPTGRPVYHNIDGLNYSSGELHYLEDPASWNECPDGAFIVIDEAHEVFPPRAHTKTVPPQVEAWAIHRHRNIDAILITQYPSSLDSFITKRVSRHRHLHRPFGLKYSRCYEWSQVNPSPGPREDETTAYRTKFRFPKRYFQYYRSAVGHTAKPRLPLMVFVKLFGVVGVTLVLTLYGIKHFYDLTQKPEERVETDRDACQYYYVGRQNGVPVILDKKKERYHGPILPNITCIRRRVRRPAQDA